MELTGPIGFTDRDIQIGEEFKPITAGWLGPNSVDRASRLGDSVIAGENLPKGRLVALDKGDGRAYLWDRQQIAIQHERITFESELFAGDGGIPVIVYTVNIYSEEPGAVHSREESEARAKTAVQNAEYARGTWLDYAKHEFRFIWGYQ